MAQLPISDPQVRRELRAYVARGALEALDRVEFASTPEERAAAAVEAAKFDAWMRWIESVGVGGRGSRFQT